jgi:hypothetical protein
MKKALICFVVALAMTLPVGVGIMCLPFVDEWFASGAGYRFFAPIFRALDSHGCETNSDIVFGTLYLLSFLISLVLAVAGWTAITRLRRDDHH